MGIHQAELYSPTLTMNPNEIKALKLIEALESDQPQSQRDLADRLDISLGLVNALLKRLFRKGFLKVKMLPKSRVTYLLTPKGVTEKSLLTYRYILYSLSYYREIQDKFRSIFSKLEIEGKKRIVLFGKGELSEIAAVVIKESHLQLAGIIDQIGQLEALIYDIVLILELENHTSVEHSLIKAGVLKNKILCL